MNNCPPVGMVRGLLNYEEDHNRADTCGGCGGAGGGAEGED